MDTAFNRTKKELFYMEFPSTKNVLDLLSYQVENLAVPTELGGGACSTWEKEYYNTEEFTVLSPRIRYRKYYSATRLGVTAFEFELDGLPIWESQDENHLVIVALDSVNCRCIILEYELPIVTNHYDVSRYVFLARKDRVRIMSVMSHEYADGILKVGPYSIDLNA